MPRPDTVSVFGVATQNSAYNYWLGIAKAAQKQHTLASALYDLWEQTYYVNYPETGWQRRNSKGEWEELNQRPPPQPEETPNIPYTEESIREYLNGSYYLEILDIEEILECLNFNNNYAYDGEDHMHYWKDENGYLPGVWEYDENDPNKATIVIELAVGGPNAHLLITYNLKEISPYPSVNNGLEKIEFQYHWWSPCYKIDLTTLPENANAEERLMYDAAAECIDQIHEIMYDNLEDN